MMFKLLLLAFFCMLTACIQVPSQQERNDYAQQLVQKKGWKQENILTDDFILRAYLPQTIQTSAVLTVYIEGDGLAWVNSSTPSFDPTPHDPLALKLALLDTTPAVYLARPCQYVVGEDRRGCGEKYWTSHRFSSEVIHSSSQAIDQLKQRFGAKELILVGYSGGGAVAALVAAQRQDVVRLITIAGNLDHYFWSKAHHMTPLFGSLNPADAADRLQNIPQLHYVGGSDQAVGESVARAYASQFPLGKRPTIVVVPDFDHHCCWVERWPSLKK